MQKYAKIVLLVVGLAILLFGAGQLFKKPPVDADWQPAVAVLPTAQFNGDKVTIRNVRNFRYGPTEKDVHPAYYDRTYNLEEIKQIWFISEPFNEQEYAAHTFLSFEFNNGDFLAITIEARKAKDQSYSALRGLLRSYPLVYIAADERDAVLLRANLRKDKVYAYPVKLSAPENARLMLVDMLERMNELAESPFWYNTLTANCTSSIARHINQVSKGRVSMWSWQLWLTASADELALKRGLLDTDLPIKEAREKYLISDKSLEIGDVEDYSKLIRH